MGDERRPDLSPTALSQLVAGMTKEEVEAVVGRYHRPNLYQGRPYYAWIGNGGMLRAFFDGPGGTLSNAVLHVPEEDRVLDLAGDGRSRLKRCTITQKWSCIACRKSYRRSAVPTFVCPICREACEQVPRGIRVPAPGRTEAWDKFWRQYNAETALLEAYGRGALRENLKLKIFGIELKGTPSMKPARRRTQRRT